ACCVHPGRSAALLWAGPKKKLTLRWGAQGQREEMVEGIALYTLVPGGDRNQNKDTTPGRPPLPLLISSLMPVIRSAEIITVGTELLLGEIVDTNSARLAQDLAELGVDVYWSLRVGDNRGRLEQALTAALARSDLVLLTGGLGPTDDDLTRDAVAHVVG